MKHLSGLVLASSLLASLTSCAGSYLPRKPPSHVQREAPTRQVDSCTAPRTWTTLYVVPGWLRLSGRWQLDAPIDVLQRYVDFETWHR